MLFSAMYTNPFITICSAPRLFTAEDAVDNFILEKLAPLLRRPNSLCSLGGSSGARSGQGEYRHDTNGFQQLGTGEFMGVDMMQGCLPPPQTLQW